MGSAAGVATPVPGRLAERHWRLRLLRRLGFRAGQRHLRDALSGVRGDDGVHPVIRRGVHLRRRQENLLQRRRVRRHGVVRCVRPLAASCEPRLSLLVLELTLLVARKLPGRHFFGSSSARGGRLHERAGNDAGEQLPLPATRSSLLRVHDRRILRYQHPPAGPAHSHSPPPKLFLLPWTPPRFGHPACRAFD